MNVVEDYAVTGKALRQCRHRVPIVANQLRQAEKLVALTEKDLLCSRIELDLAERAHGAAMLRLMTCGMSHVRVLRVVRAVW